MEIKKLYKFESYSDTIKNLADEHKKQYHKLKIHYLIYLGERNPNLNNKYDEIKNIYNNCTEPLIYCTDNMSKDELINVITYLNDLSNNENYTYIIKRDLTHDIQKINEKNKGGKIILILCFPR